MKRIVKKISVIIILAVLALTLTACGSRSKIIKLDAKSFNGEYYDRIDETCTDEKFEWIGYDWVDGEGFVKSAKGYYYYPKGGKKIVYELYRYDSNKKKWIGEYKSKETYDKETRTKTTTTYSWDYDKNKWVENK